MAMSHRLRFVAFVGAVLIFPTALAAETHQIDTERSKLTVHVYKSGLFSAFADNHIIQAPIASGSLSDKERVGGRARGENVRDESPGS